MKHEQQEAIKNFYSGGEKDRLESDLFKLEGVRTKEIIGRYLTSSPIKILDAEGGAGHYIFWLASLGHHMSLIDLNPANIDLANDYAKAHQLHLDACETGDATHLRFTD
jgi:2-polyprenyl-3-methyl-5-hydroxy-6-metoxy-1,4-benzoquinol methylase